MTRRQALIAASGILSAHPHLRDTAARDAELLLLKQLGIDRVQLFTCPDNDLTKEEESSFLQKISRRATSEPIQYITGQPGVLRPRLSRSLPPSSSHAPRPNTSSKPSSNLLPANQPLKIADIGTGSGAIAIALAAHLPHARIIALDISTEAIAVALANARTHSLAGRIQFLQSDLLSALSHEAQIFDAIVSNPPYVPESDRDTLHPQVRDYEPAAALFAGETGLDIYRRLIPQAQVALKPERPARPRDRPRPATRSRLASGGVAQCLFYQ